MKKKINRRQQRIFSEDYRRYVVSEYEQGKFGVMALSRLHKVSYQTIYKWIDKYSSTVKPALQIVEMKHSSERKLKEYEKRINELEQIVGKKQIQLDYLEELLNLASEHFGLDIKKNLSTKGLNNSDKKETL